ncbi:MAG: reverse transcriptase family protein [Chitinispirillaceae bacterium]|jgi:hypothetical protein
MQKSYQLENSPLYRLQNKQKLSELLNISVKELKSLCPGGFYKVWIKKTDNKEREIQEPIGIRKKVHLRIHTLLSRINKPGYLFSGKKGVSCIHNAKHHAGNYYFLCTDISHYYTNCKREFIFRFFYNKMQMSADLAWIMTDIVSYNGHIPTGSHLSQDLAFLIHSDIFDIIHNIANEKGISFSLYVDDMTFSSNTMIPKTTHLLINHHLKKTGLVLKRKKTKYYSKRHYKKITGVIISPTNELLIPNRHMKHIKDTITKYQTLIDIPDKEKSTLLGKLRYARQIKNDFFDNVYRLARDSTKIKNSQEITI